MQIERRPQAERAVSVVIRRQVASQPDEEVVVAAQTHREGRGGLHLIREGHTLRDVAMTCEQEHRTESDRYASQRRGAHGALVTVTST